MSEHHTPGGEDRPASEAPRPEVFAEFEDDLGRALRAEALDRRPDFSERLHSRIVDARPASHARPRLRPARMGRRRWWLAGTVAGGLLVAVLAAWQLNRPSVPDPTMTEQIAVWPSLSEPSEELAAVAAVAGTGGAEVGMMLDRTFVRSQWAYLDHDAKIAADLLIDQLPFELAFSDH